jgi:hypothetical protein
MIQIKKRLPLLLTFVFLLFPTKVFAREVQSDVVNQKSEIDEQQTQEEIVRTKPNDFVESPYFATIETLTDEEKELICRITWLESGNQPIEGQRAVIEVILNRLRLDIWPNTIYEVLSKPGQFSTWRIRNKVTKEQIEKMMEVLEIVYKEKNILADTEYVYFRNSPHKSEDTINIEGHWFWK